MTTKSNNKKIEMKEDYNKYFFRNTEMPRIFNT